MANIGVGDGPQYDERNPEPQPDPDEVCTNCHLEFGWTYLLGTATVVRCTRQTPRCALCGDLCTDCHDLLHADNEAALEQQAREDAERRAEAAAALAKAAQVQRLCGLTDEELAS